MFKFLWAMAVLSGLAKASSPVVFEDQKVRMNDFTRGLDLELTPLLRGNGDVWIAPESCTAVASVQSCDFPGRGRMTLTASGTHLALSFQAALDTDFQGFGL